MVSAHSRLKLPCEGLECLPVYAQSEQVCRVPAQIAQVSVDDIDDRFLGEVPLLKIELLQRRCMQVDGNEHLKEVQIGALVVETAYFEAL